MITIIGFLAGIIPHIFSVFKEYKEYKQSQLDQAHELAIMQLQVEIAKAQLDNQMKETEIQATVDNSVIVHQPFISNNKIVDAINNLIKPIIVFTFLGIYIYMQYNIIDEYINSDLPLSNYAELLWTDNEQAMLNAILTYYFGSFVRKN